MAKKTKKRSKRASGGSRTTRNGAWSSDAQSDWGEATPRTGGVSLPIDQGYIGRIDDAVIGSHDDGRRYVDWTLTVLEGDCEGRKCHKFSQIATKDNMDWFKGELDTLELQIPDSLDDLGDSLDAAIGVEVCFDVVKGKDEYPPNIYFRERLEGNSGNGGKQDGKPAIEYTLESIDALSEDDLVALAKENNLNPDDYTWEALPKAIWDAM